MEKLFCKIPIVFIIFNRPDTTQKVFDRIREVKPSQLFVIADGARKNKAGEAEKCQQVRQIIDTIDWECELFTNYSAINLGCQKRVSTGIDWVFQQVEEAIILEDDCLPDLSFFPFCEELLNQYRHDTRIMAISGDNFQFGRKRTSDSYYFSRYNHCWGWATWRRAWQYYDVKMTQWEKVRAENWLNDILNDPWATRYWTHKFQQVYEGKIDTWDYQWTLTCWLQSGLTILPNVNLVSNIGFDRGGTHHQTSYSPYANLKTEEIAFPLKHPSFIIRNTKSDYFTQKTMFGLLPRIYRKIRGSLKV